MKRVLILDDSLTVRMDLEEAFQTAGWSTILCASASEARETVRQAGCDCIILDVMLPDGNGLDLMRELKSNNVTARIPVMLLSGEAEIADQIKGTTIRPEAYVGKPYDRADTVSQAERLLVGSARSGSPETILVVDDSPTYRHELAKQLREDNYSLVLASSGSEALRLLQVRPVDCILLDLVMPEMPGDAVCQRIKSSPAWRLIPVVMLTGREDSEAMLESFNAGADDYVPKSSDFAVLRARLRAQLRRRQFEEETSRIREELHKKEFEAAQAKAVSESEQRMQMALQINRSFAFEWETSTDRIVRSESCGPILGVEGRELCEDTGQRYFDLVHPEDREQFRKLLSELAPGAETYHTQYRVLRKDGKTIVLEETARGFFDVTGKLSRLVGVTADITQRRQMEEELRGAQEQLRQHAANLERSVQERTAKLQELVNELEHFSYTITHDMRAPLRAIQGFTGLMGELCHECKQTESKEYIALIKRSAVRMDSLITGALQFSRAGKEAIALRPVDAAELLRGIIQSYPAFQRPNASIRVESVIPLVLATEAELTQCFSNLLGNAVKFVEAGKTPDVRVWAERVENGECRVPGPEPAGEGSGLDSGWVRIWFEDNGIGIPTEAQSKVFGMFQRATRDFEGTGVGLALVKKVAERMGGRVGVESEEGKGSRFWLELREVK